MKNKTNVENQAVIATKRFSQKQCAITAAMNVLGGKWKILIISFIQLDSPIRFGELRRKAPGITQAILTSQLRELEKDGIIVRKIFAEVPPKVQYTLTDLGMRLHDVSKQLREWGNLYLLDQEIKKAEK